MIKISVILMLVLGQCWTQFDSTLINTDLGAIRGKRYEWLTKFNRRPINAFIGIPYAKPPVGFNRFRIAEPIEMWKNEKDATNNRVMCPQVYQRFNYQTIQPIREDEDCLYLNVFIPISTRPANGYPVMVYIHGGEFRFGGKDFYPPQYLLDNDIILVTINYRLGVLGFLSNGDDFSGGNFGLHDQIEALKWVSFNINSFGGNSQNITIFGHDSGAISASILLIAPKSWGLYHNVMILSGSVFTPNAIKLPDIRMSLDFSEVLNCNLKYSLIDENVQILSRKLVDCLRTKTVEELMMASRLPGLYANEFQYNFGPVVDNNVTFPLIMDQPINIFRSGNYWKTPLVSGLTINEGSLDFYPHYDRMREWTLNEKIDYLFNRFNYKPFYAKLLSKSVDWYYFKRFNETRIRLMENKNSYQNSFYPNNPFVMKPNQNQNYNYLEQERDDITIIEALGDFMYGSANTLLLDLHSKNSKMTYLYVVEHQGIKTFGTIQRNSSQIIHRNQYGVTHMDDIFYLFPTLYSDNITSAYDDPVIRNMCQFFAHFARYGRFGQQNTGSSYQMFGNYWTPYSQQNPNYLRFLSQNPQLNRGFRSDFLNFWNYFIREIFDENYAKSLNETQISAQFIGTVQLRGMIRLGHNKFVIS